MIISVCRHMYHPWCVLMHFKQNNQCVDMHCKIMMSLDWCKSFGIINFDKEMVEKELFEGCEEACLH